MYKFPPYFDSRINERARYILLYGIPIFCVASIWSFGNPNILEKTTITSFDAAKYSENALKQDLDSFFGPLILFYKRSTNTYALFFTIILIFFILITILK